MAAVLCCLAQSFYRLDLGLVGLSSWTACLLSSGEFPEVGYCFRKTARIVGTEVSVTEALLWTVRNDKEEPLAGCLLRWARRVQRKASGKEERAATAGAGGGRCNRKLEGHRPRFVDMWSRRGRVTVPVSGRIRARGCGRFRSN